MLTSAWKLICVNSIQWYLIITVIMSPLRTQKGRHIGLLLTTHFYNTTVLCLWRWANISPVLGYRVVFDATLHVGQRHRWRANSNPAFIQSIVWVLQPAWSRPTDYGCMDTSQHRRLWPNIYQTLGGCQLALPDPQPSKHEALNQCWFYAGPASQTVGQNWTSIRSTSRVR